MWRAFFYAVGYMTIFVGFQSLAFERVQLAPGKDGLQLIKQMLRDENSGSVAGSTQQLEFPSGLQVARNASESSFGPSRFSSGGFGGSAFSASPYRGLPNGSGLGIGSGQPVNVPRVDLASYRSEVSRNQAVGGSKTLGRVIQSEEWMPWSLLAIGAVIVLYTRSVAIGSRD